MLVKKMVKSPKAISRVMPRIGKEFDIVIKDFYECYLPIERTKNNPMSMDDLIII